MKVTFIQRKPHVGNHSLEELFKLIREHLPSDCQVKLVVSPYLSLGILNRIRMGLYFRRIQQGVNHVTGDIHFVTLFLRKGHTLLTIHDCDKVMKSRGLKRFILWLFWFKLPLSRVSLVTVISQQTKDDLLQLVSFPEHKIRVIPNCVSPIFSYCPKAFNNNCPRLLAIGTKENKNLYRLFQAIEDLNCELTIIGRLSDSYQKELTNRNIKYRNRYGLSHQQIFEEYQRTDIVLLVSTKEGFGLPILEGQAVGRPVICSDVDPHRWVAGRAAWLVDPFNVDSIREGIVEAITNEHQREKMKSEGLKNVNRFSAQEVASQYYSVYRQLLNSRL